MFQFCFDLRMRIILEYPQTESISLIYVILPGTQAFKDVLPKDEYAVGFLGLVVCASYAYSVSLPQTVVGIEASIRSRSPNGWLEFPIKAVARLRSGLGAIHISDIRAQVQVCYLISR